MNLFGLIFVRWKALVDSERKKNWRILFDYLCPSAIWGDMESANCSINRSNMDFFSGEFHISLMFVFRHFASMLDSQSLRFIERIIINEEEKNQRPHIKINDFYLETKRLPIRLEIVECAIYTVFICETHQNRSHSNEVICVIPQQQRDNTHRWMDSKHRKQNKNYYRIIVQTYLNWLSVVECFVNMALWCDWCSVAALRLCLLSSLSGIYNFLHWKRRNLTNSSKLLFFFRFRPFHF